MHQLFPWMVKTVIWRRVPNIAAAGDAPYLLDILKCVHCNIDGTVKLCFFQNIADLCSHCIALIKSLASQHNHLGANALVCDTHTFPSAILC